MSRIARKPDAPAAAAITSADLRKRLVEKYSLSDGWITMAEVTPPKTSRRFDLVALMGWGSRGHEVMGFELKVSRSDWLRELADPAKAEPLVRLVSRWWIVAPPGVVQEAELPPAWGLLVVHPEQIRTGKQAPQLNPEPWPDEVWRCMMLRLATREDRKPDDLVAEYKRGLIDGEARAINWNQREFDQMKRELEEKRRHVAEIEAACGVTHWNWARTPAIAQAVKMLAEDPDGLGRSLLRKAVDMTKAAEGLRTAAITLGAKP